MREPTAGEAAISLGAGVQSTTMALMAACGEIEPMPVAAIFADTGWEPRAVYEHLVWLEAQLPFPVVRVTAGNIREDIMRGADAEDASRFASMPLYVASPTGEREGMLRRQCTREYKVAPLSRAARDLGATADAPLSVWIGITVDEAHRMKPSRVKYTEHRWPLIEARMTRHDCVMWLSRHGYPPAPRSACIGCPFRSDHEWRMIRDDDEAWADAVEVDQAIRRLPRIEGEAYLHRSLRPLADVDLSTEEDRGQLSLWGNECEGMCGV